jgi:hypothetical protein
MKYVIALCALCLCAMAAPACDPVVTAGAGLTMGYGTAGCVGAAPVFAPGPGCGVGRAFAPSYGAVGFAPAPVFATAPVYTTPAFGVTVVGGGGHHHHRHGHVRIRGRF